MRTVRLTISHRLKIGGHHVAAGGRQKTRFQIEDNNEEAGSFPVWPAITFVPRGPRSDTPGSASCCDSADSLEDHCCLNAIARTDAFTARRRSRDRMQPIAECGLGIDRLLQLR